MRVKRGVKARKRRNRIFKLAKGFRGRSKNTIRQATQRVEKALCYVYRDRKVRKREMRSLWIIRISAAAKLNGMSYSKLMGGLKKADINVNRKELSDLGIKDPAAFTRFVEIAKEALLAA